MKTNLSELGSTLRRLRLASGQTIHQVESAAEIGFATLPDIEAGRGDPTIDTLRSLARVYGEDITITIEATTNDA